MKEQEPLLEETIHEVSNEEANEFELKPKMVLNIARTLYKVITVRPNGKATIKPIRKAIDDKPQ
jgi:hypothetical protein